METEKYLQDYKTLVSIKNRVIALAGTISGQTRAQAAVMYDIYSDNKFTFDQQTEQGFALVWDVTTPKLIWKLGICEFVARSSITGNGDELLREKIVKEFGAEEMSKTPRLLSMRNGQQIPIGDQQIITYSLQKFHNRSLPEAALKKPADLVDEAAARKIYKELKTY